MVTFISNISFASNFIDTTEDTIIESKAITEMTEKDFLNLKEELLLENVSEEQANNLIVKLKKCNKAVNLLHSEKTLNLSKQRFSVFRLHST